MADRTPLETKNLDIYGSAPSAGPPPWHLYRFTFHTTIGNATAEPHGATRWRFEQ